MEQETFNSKEEKMGFTSLLLKELPTHLGDNYARAKAVFSTVENCAKKNGTVGTINQAYTDMLVRGFTEKVPENE
jgi:hypothetical protein